MDKQTVVRPYHGIWNSAIKQERNILYTHDLDKSQSNYVQLKSQYQKVAYHDDSIYITFLN